ncbi:MAG: hypothetical protein KJ077_32820 [Anaerolineae bacterium]|nr:hypothetical protein [Anaerolineae bacterium]
MNQEEVIYISARVPVSLDYWVRIGAAQLRSSRSEYIRQALEERLQRQGLIELGASCKSDRLDMLRSVATSPQKQQEDIDAS